MRGRAHTATRQQPTKMIHHIREIQLRLLSVVAVLIVGMVVGYFYYEPLFEFIKAPLSGPLHYMSPAGSFTFILQICLMAGIVLSLPVAVYNGIMFIQPALSKRLSRRRVYITTLTSLMLVVAGAAFGFLLIIPLALKFFSGFQVNGLEAIISADEYLRFVVGIIITFVLIFQLPLLMSLADHIKPLPPKKMLKFEKYIVLGSIFVAVVVPFANDLTVQTLIASPIIILYNVSIVVVLVQHVFRSRRARKVAKHEAKQNTAIHEPRIAEPAIQRVEVPGSTARPTAIVSPSQPQPVRRPARRTVDGMRPVYSLGAPRVSQAHTLAPKATSKSVLPQNNNLPTVRRAERRLITDMRSGMPPARSRLATPPRTMPLTPRRIVD